MRRSAAALLLAACGTYSHVRTADNLAAGHVELAGGIAWNGLGEGVAVGAAAIGITDWLEVEGQYEVYSGYGELRAGLLSSEANGIAVALGVGVGGASVYANDWSGGTAGLADLVIGRRWSRFEVYAGDRFLYLPDNGYTINSIRGGLRVGLGPIFVGGEGGATLHQGALWLGEGTVLLGLRL